MLAQMKSSLAALALLLSLPLSARADEKIDLRLRWSKGDTHHVSVSLDQTVDQVLGTAHQQTTQTVGVKYTFKVADLDAQGNATLSVQYDSVSFHARTPSGVIDYDPGKPANGPMPVTVSALAALVGQSYSVTVDPHGKVTQIIGLQKMLDAVLSHLNASDGVLRAALERTIRQQLSEPNLKQSLHDVFAPFPDHPVAIGESWTRALPVSMGFPMNLRTTYTLKSVEDGVASIAIAGKATTAPNAMLDMGAVKMDYDLKGEQTGSLEITQSTGWTRSASLSQHLAGSATLRGPNADPQIVPMTIQSEVKCEEK
jgi:hypothetical protein